MKLTVLGKYGPYPAPGGATSGYLVQEGQTNVLIDCGSGVISRLQQIIPLGSLSAIVLSHLHSDHIVDLFVLRYAFQQMQSIGEATNLPIKVFAPSVPQSAYNELRGIHSFEYLAILDGMSVRLGELEMFFSAMLHPFPSFGVRVYGQDRVLAYTGDTKLHDGIVPFATHSDLFVADTGLLERDKTGDNVPHLTAREVGDIARMARVRRLLCSHINPRYDEADVLAEARLGFPAAELAKEMETYEI